MAPAPQPTAAPSDAISELIADPSVISAHIRQLDEELKLAHALYRLAVLARPADVCERREHHAR